MKTIEALALLGAGLYFFRKMNISPSVIIQPGGGGGVYNDPGVEIPEGGGGDFGNIVVTPISTNCHTSYDGAGNAHQCQNGTDWNEPAGNPAGGACCPPRDPWCWQKVGGGYSC